MTAHILPFRYSDARELPRVEFGDTRLPERFWAKVALLSSDCWEWRGALSSKGYGNFGVGNGRTGHSHRVAYLALIGDIPPQLELDHLCRNRACVNPAHLEAVSGRVNNLRGTSPAALRARRTHCPRGHALRGNNLDPAELKRSGNRSYVERFGSSRRTADRLLGGAEPMVEAS